MKFRDVKSRMEEKQERNTRRSAGLGGVAAFYPKVADIITKLLLLSVCIMRAQVFHLISSFTLTPLSLTFLKSNFCYIFLYQFNSSVVLTLLLSLKESEVWKRVKFEIFSPLLLSWKDEDEYERND